MRCQFCNADDDKVIDSRATDGGRCTRRRRQCLKCGRRYTTYERIEDRIKLSVIKRDGSRSPYDRERIREAIRQSAYKRPITSARIDQIVEEVESELVGGFEKEVSSLVVAEKLAAALRKVDKVSYVRFASVFRQFEDVGEFIEEAQELIEEAAGDIPGQRNLFDGSDEGE